MRQAVVLLAMAAGWAAHAQGVHRCVDAENRTVFQEKPCPGSVQRPTGRGQTDQKKVLTPQEAARDLEAQVQAGLKRKAEAAASAKPQQAADGSPADSGKTLLRQQMTFDRCVGSIDVTVRQLALTTGQIEHLVAVPGFTMSRVCLKDDRLVLSCSQADQLMLVQQWPRRPGDGCVR